MTDQLPLTEEQVERYEIEFVGQAIFAAGSRESHKPGQVEKDHQLAWAAFDAVEPEYLSDTPLRIVYGTVREMFVQGEPIDPSTLADSIQNHIDDPEGHAQEWYELALENAYMSAQLASRQEIVLREYRRREFFELASNAQSMLRGPHGVDGGQHLATVMAMKLIELFSGSTRGPQNQYPTPKEVIDRLRERAETGEERGVSFPWPKLEKLCGPMIPGEVVGVTAYSNQGKSLFASNLFWELAARRVCVIGFPTEMMWQWVERGMARNAHVSQWRAEKGRWKDPEGEFELQKYLAALKEAEEMDNWRVVARPDISPAEIAMSVRILRKQWPDRTVVFIVDHMHRLNYGGEKSDEQVGEATKLLHNIAMEDGNLLPVLLFQPKKPEGGREPYGPIGGHRIRGHSSVWNELDIHLSPWRAVVETMSDEDNKTPWGTVRARLNRKGLPIIRKPTEQMLDRKWDDENFHIKVDKRRTGGVGPNVVLPIHSPSGRIFEAEPEEDDNQEQARFPT